MQWFRNNPGKTGIIVMILGFGGLAALALTTTLVGIGGWYLWPSGEEEIEEVVVTDEVDETTIEDAVTDEEVDMTAQSEDAPESTWWNGSWWEDQYRSWNGDDTSATASTVTADNDDTGEIVVTPGQTVETMTVTTSSTSTTPPETGTSAVLTGIKPSGTAFPARNTAGNTVSTLAVVVEGVPQSARAEDGLEEELWLQGVRTDPVSGVLVEDASPHRVVDIDDVREAVNVNQTWKPIPGYTGVRGKCQSVWAANGEIPASCTPRRLASR